MNINVITSFFFFSSDIFYIEVTSFNAYESTKIVLHAQIYSSTIFMTTQKQVIKLEQTDKIVSQLIL
jgi:hypothetical protein